MNILVPDKWLREYVRTKKTPASVARDLSLVGPAVERIHRQGENLERIVVGRVARVEKHPNADKLRIVVTDIGRKELSIVCGGSNLREGQLVAVAQIGARVRWHGEGELVKLEQATIRGVKSEGMICAANEIGLFELFPHAEREIMDLSETFAKPGTSLARVLGLHDVVYEIEVTTNRPDALGVVGIAREVAAATGGVFLWREPEKPKAIGLKSDASVGARMPRRLASGRKALSVSIQAKRLCSRYQGALIEGISVKDSPAWMQRRLASAGLRPINAVVDITNYVMLELGEPMHAFDADTVKEHSIVVRTARAGEKIAALDGKDYPLTPWMLVIADPMGPLAVAGVIGGQRSKVTTQTKNIILEAASFEATSVRKTSRALGVRTDASNRFQQNMPQGLTAPALARAVELILKICGGSLVAHKDVCVQKEKSIRVQIPYSMLLSRIGIELSLALIKKLLISIGFVTTANTQTVRVQVPYWRKGDVAIPEDLVEEVSRLYGYHKLPAVLPPGYTNDPADTRFHWEQMVRRTLVGCGAQDTISISLVNDMHLKRSGEADAPVIRIANPLTEELTTLRPSHRSRLIEAVRQNEKMKKSGALFEIGNVFTPPTNQKALPEERLSLGVIVWGSGTHGQPFYELKGMLEQVSLALHVPLTYGKDAPQNEFWHPGRSVAVHLGAQIVGVLGELTPFARDAAGVESRVALATIDLASIFERAKTVGTFRAPSAFPPVLRDIAFVLDRRAEHGVLIGAIQNVDPLITEVELFDHFEGKGIPEGKKSLAYHLIYQSREKTLTAAEVDVIHKKVTKLLESQFKATIRQ